MARQYVNVISFLSTIGSIEISKEDYVKQEKKVREAKKEGYTKAVKEKTGHDLLKIDISTRAVEYLCGNCGEVSHSFIRDLLVDNKGNCGNRENGEKVI